MNGKMVQADADVQVGQTSVSFGAEGEVMDLTEARWAVIAAPVDNTARVESKPAISPGFRTMHGKRVHAAR
jgi:hypothetical protein